MRWILYDNYVMLIGGILVGSAGTILTVAMCTAMNRSLLNVLVGNFGGNASATGGSSSQGSNQGNLLSDASVLMKYSKKLSLCQDMDWPWHKLSIFAMNWNPS